MRSLLFILSFLLVFSAWSQNISRDEYVDYYKDIAISEMKRAGVPASITLAQGVLESNNGNSTLAVKANNHFGIKCHKEWEGKTVRHDDDARNECFRKYKNPEDSFKDHSDFLLKYSRYAFLFDYKITDYKSWAHGLKKAGYATHNKYDKLLIKIIEENKLYRFDDEKYKQAKEQLPKPELILADNVDDFEIAPFASKVKTRNRIDYVIAEEGDTYESISEVNDFMPWQLYKYNERTKGAVLNEGEIVYLQPKRRKADIDHKWHVLGEGETMYQVSQEYGIKLKHLYRKNNIEFGSTPKPGTRLSLRKKVRSESK